MHKGECQEDQSDEKSVEIRGTKAKREGRGKLQRNARTEKKKYQGC